MSAAVAESIDAPPAERMPRLQALFVLFAVVCATGVLVLVGLGQYDITRRLVIEHARHDSLVAASLARTLGDDVIGSLLHEDVAPPNKSMAAFEVSLQSVFVPFEVFRVRLYDPRGLIAYSTDRTLMGRSDLANENLRLALAGEVNTHVQRDRVDASRPDVDVMKAYMPVVDHTGSVVGAFEVSLDMTPYLAKSDVAMRQSLLIVAGVLLVTFTLLAGLMGRATNIVAAHARAVGETNDRLRTANDRLERLATTDVLTGLLNRRGAMDRFEEAWSLADRNRAALSCILIDVDHFKRINDDFGHAVGDDVLRRLAMCLVSRKRGNEVLCRVGGEEFLVICPLTTAAEAAIGAERMRAAVEEEFTDAAGRGTTVSAGVAQRSTSMERIDNLLGLADEALYIAKREGRNRVRVSESPYLDTPQRTG